MKAVIVQIGYGLVIKLGAGAGVVALLRAAPPPHLFTAPLL